MILKHLLMFGLILAALAVITTWVIFFKMVRENLKTGEIKKHQ
jgi:hypothetical protein